MPEKKLPPIIHARWIEEGDTNWLECHKRLDDLMSGGAVGEEWLVGVYELVEVKKATVSLQTKAVKK